MTSHRVNLVADPKFYAKTEEKAALAYVSLAENKSKRQPDGTFTDQEPTFYNGIFQGKAAEALERSFRKGDALLVSGNVKTETVEKDGREFTNKNLFVKAFGPDAAYMQFSIERGAGREHQAAAAAPAQDADQEPARATATIGEPADARADAYHDLGARARELVNVGRLTENQLEELQHMDTGEGPETWAEKLHTACRSMGLPDAERHYLASAVEARFGLSEPIDWVGAEARATAERPAPLPAVPQPQPVPAM